MNLRIAALLWTVTFPVLAQEEGPSVKSEVEFTSLSSQAPRSPKELSQYLKRSLKKGPSWETLKVLNKTVEPDRCKLVADAGDGISVKFTISQTKGLDYFEDFVVGQEYAIPSEDEHKWHQYFLFAAGRPPFKARLLDKRAGESEWRIDFQNESGGVANAYGNTTGPIGDLMSKMVANLKVGDVYEFPRAYLDAMRVPPFKPTEPKAACAEVEPLARYIGRWEGASSTSSGARYAMNCIWKAGGGGIWRTITVIGSTEPAREAVICYNYATKRFVDRLSDPTETTPIEMTWEEASKSFISRTAGSSPGTERVNTATFTTADRIDWQTVEKTADGKVLTTTSGHYDRVKS